MSVIKRGVAVFRLLWIKPIICERFARAFAKDPLNDPEFDIFDAIPDSAISLYPPMSPC